MIDISLIVLCAGSSTRFSSSVQKIWLRTGNYPIWFELVKKLSKWYTFGQTIVVCNRDDINYMKNFSRDIVFVKGGKTRQQSIKNALVKVNSKYSMVTDCARVNVTKELIDKLITYAEQNRKIACVVPYLKVVDTVKYSNKTIDREDIRLIQTPQLSKTNILKDALKIDDFTDDSSAINAIGENVAYIDGYKNNIKITYIDDIKQINYKPPCSDIFSGNGIDIHEFEDNKPMILGGVLIDSPFGFKAHSDGDVLIHSLIDSILGAIGAGDIGEWFPSNNNNYKNIDSKKLLLKVVKFVKKIGFEFVNTDISIIAQTPYLKNYKEKIRSNISSILQINNIFVNIKATTAENLGFIGRKEGICVICNTNLKYHDWTKYADIDSRK